ncbi:type I-E CRISPR-associated protein Cas6/Cse3/CasE [Streptomyces sp. NPDC000594]|uniref:type I-E CRISPR-associated protein Cas6/Cse3/CasE n=1 Tax=Streptomyces sp. NPDC000594 TaxID=3154261 RepID=UPI00331F4FDD
MTYLSRVRINPLRAESRKLLASPRAMHGAVLGGIPGGPDGGRALWRLDADDPRRPWLLVLTPERPDWSHIVEAAGWPGADGDHAVVRPYAPLLERLAAGQEYAFRLTANPVQSTVAPLKPTTAQKLRIEARGEGERMRGFRLAHRTAATQLDWFLRRTGAWGFEVPVSRTDAPAPGFLAADTGPALPPEGPERDPAPEGPERDPAREVRITARHRHSFRKSDSGVQVTFHSATFEGRLRVTDPAGLAARLLGGIGPSKAYGCGLLTLAPVAPVEPSGRG